MFEKKERDNQRLRVAAVINLGKKQGYLTYTQIKKILPAIADNEHFNVIISRLEDMNIRVFKQTPNDDELALLSVSEEMIADAKIFS